MTVEGFRRAAAEAPGGGGTGKRYSAQLREFAVAHARQEMGRGRAVAAVARSLGVPGQTLTYWLKRSGAKAPTVVRVRLRGGEETLDSTAACTPVAASAGVVVMAPNGYRVAMGSVEEAAALLRALR